MTGEWKNAVRRGAVDRLEELLRQGADLNARDGHGQTALMRAARGGQLVLTQWLLARGAALDHTAKYGLSAVMLATLNGHEAIVRALVAAGADLTLAGTGAPGFAGQTAVDLARARGDQGMVELLSAAAERRDR
jgi:ankyrin repeat protein